jgi:hypothetical protein
MNDEAPQWLHQAFAAQAQQIQELAAQNANTMANLASRIDAQDERLRAPPGTTSARTMTPPLIPQITPDPVVRRPRPSLPHPDQFTGKNPALYPQFESMLKAKLEIDGRTIGEEKEQVWYAFGRLSGEAAGRIHPWIMHAQRTNTLTTDSFFKQIRLAFSDPRASQKALEKINRTKQGITPFNDFLNEFNRLILEAEGWGWDDKVKKAYLRTAISYKLKDRTIGLKEEESYEEYCSQLRMISDQLAELKDSTNRRTAWTKERTVSPQRESAPEAMDWEPSTTVATARTMRKESRWAPFKEIERRRKEGLCLRCGKDDHFARECRTTLKPAKKKEVKIAVVKSKEEPEVVLTSDSEDSENSGKE